MKQDREKLRNRLKALLGKTVANGCTEDEAMTAAAKAAELMRDYGISEAELDIAVEAIGWREDRVPRHVLWGAITFVTNTKAIYTREREGKRVKYYGIEPGPQIAAYLHDLCGRAIDSELRIYRSSEFYKRRRNAVTRRAAADDFTKGMIVRLSRRVVELFHDTHDHDRALAASNACAAAHPDAKSMKTKPPKAIRYAEAAGAGYDAGNRVALHHGVNSVATRAITGGAS